MKKCPRCLTDSASVISRSPVPGVWEMFNCATCGYSWRSTDILQNSSPEHFPAEFRLDGSQLNRLADFPPLPKTIAK